MQKPFRKLTPHKYRFPLRCRLTAASHLQPAWILLACALPLTFLSGCSEDATPAEPESGNEKTETVLQEEKESARLDDASEDFGSANDGQMGDGQKEEGKAAGSSSHANLKPAVIEQKADLIFYPAVLSEGGLLAGRFADPAEIYSSGTAGYYDTQAEVPERTLLEGVPAEGDQRLLDASDEHLLVNVIGADQITVLLCNLNDSDFTPVLEFPLDESHVFDVTGRLLEDQNLVLLNYGENGVYQSFAYEIPSGKTTQMTKENSSLPFWIGDTWYYIATDPDTRTTSLKSLSDLEGSSPEVVQEWQEEEGLLTHILPAQDQLLLFVSHNANPGTIDSTPDTQDYTECLLYDPATGHSEVLLSEKGQISAPMTGGNLLTWWNPADFEEGRVHTKYSAFDLEKREKLSYEDGQIIPGSSMLLWTRYNKDESEIPVGQTEQPGNISLVVEDIDTFIMERQS